MQSRGPPPGLRRAQGTHQDGERVSWGRRALRKQEVASRLCFVTLPQRGHKEGKGPQLGVEISRQGLGWSPAPAGGFTSSLSPPDSLSSFPFLHC